MFRIRRARLVDSLNCCLKAADGITTVKFSLWSMIP